MYSGYNTPNNSRYSASFMPSHSLNSPNDTRASLQRRFTVDSNIIPTLSPIGHQPAQAAEPVDMTTTVSTPNAPS